MIRFCAIALILVPVAGTAQIDAESAVSKYKALTSTELRCNRPASADQIIVCANRDADRYRVPFVGYDIGDPRAEGFWGEKERIQHQTTPCEDRGAFRLRCGSVGISVAVGLNGDGLKWRKRAD